MTLPDALSALTHSDALGMLQHARDRQGPWFDFLRQTALALLVSDPAPRLNPAALSTPDLLQTLQDCSVLSRCCGRTLYRVRDVCRAALDELLDDLEARRLVRDRGESPA